MVRALAPRLPVRVEEAGRVRAWGGAAQKYARVPTLVVLLQVLHTTTSNKSTSDDDCLCNSICKNF
jgi:hypothetical protein